MEFKNFSINYKPFLDAIRTKCGIPKENLLELEYEKTCPFGVNTHRFEAGLVNKTEDGIVTISLGHLIINGDDLTNMNNCCYEVYRVPREINIGKFEEDKVDKEDGL